MTGISRWFGAVKRKDGKFEFLHALTSACSQWEFVHNVLVLQEGDIIVDLFCNDTLTVVQYEACCKETFFHKKKKSEK